MARVDDTGTTVRVAEDGLTKVDGIPAFRRIVRDGRIYLQFRDRDSMRSSCRGSIYAEIPLDVLVELLKVPDT